MNNKPHIHKPAVNQVVIYEPYEPQKAELPPEGLSAAGQQGWYYSQAYLRYEKVRHYNWQMVYGDQTILIVKELPAATDRPTQQQIAESLEKIIQLHDEASKVAWEPADYAKELMSGKSKRRWASEQSRGLWLFRHKVTA